MSTYQVVEKFVSINGEGRRAGELAAFIRFKSCNLQCSYCDTSWANEPGCESERLTKEEILSWIRETGVKNVTLTGGEPLLREGMEELIEAILEDPSQRVEIETNGSVDLKPYHILKKTVRPLPWIIKHRTAVWKKRCFFPIWSFWTVRIR